MERVRDRRVNVTVEVEEDLKRQKNYFLQETKSAKDTVKVCDWSSSRTIVAGPSTVHSILPSIIFSISPLVFLSMVVGGSWSPAPGSGLPHQALEEALDHGWMDPSVKPAPTLWSCQWGYFLPCWWNFLAGSRCGERRGIFCTAFAVVFRSLFVFFSYFTVSVSCYWNYPTSLWCLWS